MSDNQFVVANEDDAWKILRRALSKELGDEPIDIRFEGWPVLQLEVRGRRWESSVPTRIMPAILEYQKHVHRVYCRTQYGTWDVRKLTNDEREQLELVVKVKPGSSQFVSALDKVLDKLVSAGVDKMDPNTLAVVILGVALMLVANSAWKAWLNTRAAEKELDHRLAMSREEKAKIELIAEAVGQSEDLEYAREATDETRNHLIKSLEPQDEMDLGEGTEISGAVAKQIARRPREMAHPDRLDGVFRILAVDASEAGVFKLKLRQWEGDEEFRAIVREADLTDTQRRALQRGEWERAPIEASINIRRLRGEITSAEIVRVALVRQRAG